MSWKCQCDIENESKVEWQSSFLLRKLERLRTQQCYKSVTLTVFRQFFVVVVGSVEELSPNCGRT